MAVALRVAAGTRQEHESRIAYSSPHYETEVPAAAEETEYVTYVSFSQKMRYSQEEEDYVEDEETVMLAEEMEVAAGEEEVHMEETNFLE